ncbi:MAG: SPOR domain-containing protein [Alphaproteobacteria bacterium]|nr:SPOR domain-containing protein [Alphaproteobacteria bacterium]
MTHSKIHSGANGGSRFIFGGRKNNNSAAHNQRDNEIYLNKGMAHHGNAERDLYRNSNHHPYRDQDDSRLGEPRLGEPRLGEPRLSIRPTDRESIDPFDHYQGFRPGFRKEFNPEFAPEFAPGFNQESERAPQRSEEFFSPQLSPQLSPHRHAHANPIGHRDDFHPLRLYDQKQHNNKEDLKTLSFWQEDDALPEDTQEEWSERSSPLKFVLTISGLVVFASIAWFSYRWASQPSTDSIPLIQAEQGPFKVKPESPGGTNVPHQDMLVYRRWEPNSGTQVEQLLPPDQQSTVMPAPMPMQAQQYPTYDPQQQTAQPGYAQPGYNQPEYAPQPYATNVAPGGGYQQQPMMPPPAMLPYNGQQPMPYGYGVIVPGQQPIQQQQIQQPIPQQPMMQATIPPVPAADTVQQVQAEKPKAVPGFYIQMSTLETETLAKAESNKLRKKHANELMDCELVIRPQATNSGKEAYGVLAGPFPSRNEAARKCSKMGNSCRVTQMP